MKKIVCILTLAALVLGGLSAGGSREAAPAKGVTITHWYWADNSAYSALMQEMVKDFNATNGKGITVAAEEYPWSGGKYSENLFTAVMGGGGPDTSSWKLTATPLFTANKLLARLDPFLDKWDRKSGIDPNLFAIMKAAGKSENTFVMPWNTQVLYVYYRPSMFKAAGIGVPKTYEEFLNAIKVLTRDTDGDGKIDVYGFGMRGAQGGQEPWGSFIHGRGGSLKDLTSAASVQGMQDFIDIFKNGFVPPSAPSDGFSQIIANFKSGKTAMTVHHTGSAIGMVETFGDDVSAFPFPAGKGQWTSMGDTENVIFESCKNKEAAFQWLAYLAAGKGQATWCEKTMNVPVYSEVQKLPVFQNNRFMKASMDSVSYAGIFPILDTTTEWISVTWPNTVARALFGELTARQAMEILQKDLYR